MEVKGQKLSPSGLRHEFLEGHPQEARKQFEEPTTKWVKEQVIEGELWRSGELTGRIHQVGQGVVDG